MKLIYLNCISHFGMPVARKLKYMSASIELNLNVKNSLEDVSKSFSRLLNYHLLLSSAAIVILILPLAIRRENGILN